MCDKNANFTWHCHEFLIIIKSIKTLINLYDTMIHKNWDYTYNEQITEGTKVITDDGRKGVVKLAFPDECHVLFETGPEELIPTSKLTPAKNDNFHLYGTKVFEYTAQNGRLHQIPINRRDLYTKVGATTTQQKQKLDRELVDKRIKFIAHIEFVSNPELNYDRYRIDKQNGVITVENAPIPFNRDSWKFRNDGKYGFQGEYVGIDIIEQFLNDLFEDYTPFIKKWLALYSFSNFTPTPTLILFGPRGTGKSKFAELVANIYPNLSADWNGEDNNFNPELKKKLLIIEENSKLSKKQYRTLKKVSGASTLWINEKNEKPYEIRNNTNQILLSNNPLPMYVESTELPSSELNNQFFVYKMDKVIQNPDPDIMDVLKQHLGAYLRSELYKVWDSMILEGRYSLKVPITSWEKKLYQNNVTRLQDAAKNFLDDLLDELRKYKLGGSRRRGFIYEHPEEIEDLLELLLDGFMATKLIREFGPKNHSSTDLRKELFESGVLGDDQTRQNNGTRKRGKVILHWPELDEFKKKLLKSGKDSSDVF